MIHFLVIIFAVFYLVLFVINLFEKSVIQQVHITLMFFVLAALCLQIELPYTFIASDDTIVEGVQVFNDFAASVFFSLMGFVQLVLTVFYKGEAEERKKKKKMGLE